MIELKISSIALVIILLKGLNASMGNLYVNNTEFAGAYNASSFSYYENVFNCFCFCKKKQKNKTSTNDFGYTNPIMNNLGYNNDRISTISGNYVEDDTDFRFKDFENYQ